MNTSLKRYSPNTVHCQQCPRQCAAPAGSGRERAACRPEQRPPRLSATAKQEHGAGAQRLLLTVRYTWVSFGGIHMGLTTSAGNDRRECICARGSTRMCVATYTRFDHAAGLSRSNFISSEVTRLSWRRCTPAVSVGQAHSRIHLAVWLCGAVPVYRRR